MLPRKCPACKNKSLSYRDNYVFCTSCPIYKKPVKFFQKPLAWAEDKQWWWRLPILIWFVIMLLKNLKGPLDGRLNNPLMGLDLGIHELGHVLFSPLGEFMHILGGSLFQVLFPLLWLLGFLQKRWYFAASMCFIWLSLNLLDVAVYVADARARTLPLSVGLGVFGIDPADTDKAYDSAHDWYQLLSRMGKLNSDLAIANGLRAAAIFFLALGTILGSVLLIQMIINSVRRLRHRPRI